MSSSSLLQSAFGSTDVYSILGLSPSPPPSSSSIKKAYHRAALLYHPDKCPVEATAEEKEERTKKFQAVSLCYEVRRARAQARANGVERDKRSRAPPRPTYPSNARAPAC